MGSPVVKPERFLWNNTNDRYHVIKGTKEFVTLLCVHCLLFLRTQTLNSKHKCIYQDFKMSVNIIPLLAAILSQILYVHISCSSIQKKKPGFAASR